MTFSFCESVHASSRSRWHIRCLTKVGKKLSGGIDTKSLCGGVSTGWDLAVDFKNIEVYAESNSVCLQCLSEWRSYEWHAARKEQKST